MTSVNLSANVNRTVNNMSIDKNKKLTSFLVEYAKEIGSQAEAARKLGIHPVSYNRYVMGHTTPSLAFITKFLTVSGWSPKKLFKHTNNP